MTLYALVDEDIQIARHRSKGTLAVFVNLDRLKEHAWRYQASDKTYKVAELEIEQIYELEEKE
ncbi:hypothetical protein [Listeria booriae]|uniref:hypothetical protein n=1 Tax=Listeria booriae TaxID=1552123 RepID=UPI001629BEB4|nr:hypothetical protein [Listeria booriae]MBC2104029.1 hypothetical protein [Listeria booriae]